MVGIPHKAWQRPLVFISAPLSFATLQIDRETLEKIQQRLTEGSTLGPTILEVVYLSHTLKMSVALLNLLK